MANDDFDNSKTDKEMLKKLNRTSLRASFNPENGHPQIIDNQGNILTEGFYSGFAKYDHEGKTYIVASQFWEGTFPTNTLLEVTKVVTGFNLFFIASNGRDYPLGTFPSLEECTKEVKNLDEKFNGWVDTRFMKELPEEAEKIFSNYQGAEFYAEERPSGELWNFDNYEWKIYEE